MSKEIEERLSEAVRKYSALYDKTSVDFRDKGKKSLALDDVGNLFIYFYLITSIFIQVKIRFNKCTISNTVANTAINAFSVGKYEVD